MSGAVTQETTFHRVCAQLAVLLEGPGREEVVDDAAKAGDFGRALLRLRDRMRANVWKTGAGEIDIERTIAKFDRKTRLDGFHVLNDWDGISDKVNPDTIPVDVLHFVKEHRGDEPVDVVALRILLDYHFMHVLALLSVRVWDEGDADDNLDRVDRLLQLLQGEHGSGQRFAADAEMLILIATSHYELSEGGYATLLEQVRTLSPKRQLRIARQHASSMGSHLRFGFEATYGRDTVNMRDDNVADYPWLCFALATVMREYERLHAAGVQGRERECVVEALINGLSCDARAFVGAPPSSLSQVEAERADFAARFRRLRADVLPEFERYRPTARQYSPLSFYFNFSHNVIKGAVVDAVLRGAPWPVTLNDLLTGITDGVGAERPNPGPAASNELKESLARTLMAYARANPHKIRGKLMPVIVYDPSSGREAFGIAMRKLRE